MEDSLHNNHITIIPFLARENASDDLLFGEPSLVRRNEMIINETINEIKWSLMKWLMKWNDYL